MISILPLEIKSFVQEFKIATKAAVLAGREALKYYRKKGLMTREKKPGDFVTEADLAANRIILEMLHQHFPKDRIVSEESPPDEEDKASDRLWLVDPLDGTNDFISQTGEFSVMVGLALNGKCQLGAVYRPDPGILHFGGIGIGAWMVEQPTEEKTPHPLILSQSPSPRLRFVCSRSHPDPKLEQLKTRLKNAEIVLCGSVGLKCAMIAQDQADLYVHPVPFLKEWDTCAPEALLRGAGGIVTDCYGKEFRYGKKDPHQPGGIFAAPQEIWNRVAKEVFSVAPDQAKLC
ncbi:MAG TPA: inositol monophosphatase family protein [Bdellovibrionota bacterium]|nr:inositol monophosphatase family protein [Bdellovibrionota bacterium]